MLSPPHFAKTSGGCASRLFISFRLTELPQRVCHRKKIYEAKIANSGKLNLYHNTILGAWEFVIDKLEQCLGAAPALELAEMTNCSLVYHKLGLHLKIVAWRHLVVLAQAPRLPD